MDGVAEEVEEKDVEGVTEEEGVTETEGVSEVEGVGEEEGIKVSSIRQSP